MTPLGPVTDIQIALGIIAGLLATIISAITQSPSLPSDHKRLVSGIITTVFGIFAALVSGAVLGFPEDWKNMLISIGLYVAGAIVVAQTFYAQFKPILNKLSAITSPGYTPKRAINEGEANAIGSATVDNPDHTHQAEEGASGGGPAGADGGDLVTAVSVFERRP